MKEKVNNLVLFDKVRARRRKPLPNPRRMTPHTGRLLGRAASTYRSGLEWIRLGAPTASRRTQRVPLPKPEAGVQQEMRRYAWWPGCLKAQPTMRDATGAWASPDGTETSASPRIQRSLATEITPPGLWDIRSSVYMVRVGVRRRVANTRGLAHTAGELGSRRR
jgi:hypothetical protein